MCGPLSADFDGNYVHLSFTQFLAAKQKVLELFSIEKQMLGSDNGNLNLHPIADALLSLKIMLKRNLMVIINKKMNHHDPIKVNDQQLETKPEMITIVEHHPMEINDP
ncbi:hypothetical protein RHMOL_Rhmol11G0075800 [Rhododendron molle]|uniref:Uncharacterized protein n=1 Tax=Rhododendron molle TaxID=49168 RepID=A0ACC0LQS2_RHOML|nr:hypothetical protein RHMOL_Rhmol11G0075800 [Rhododendron molle]